MRVEHEFEDAETGDELTLEPDMTYTVASTFVEIHGVEDEEMVFTHRVRLGVQV